MQDPRRARFGPADERPYRRLTGDALRLAFAVIVVAVTSARADNVSTSQTALDRFLTSLPDTLDGVFAAAFAVGTLWGVGVVLGAALIARRVRLAGVLALAGIVAWWLARAISLLQSGDGLTRALTDAFSGTGGEFPAVRLAVISALLLTASPFLSRPVRRMAQILLVLLVPGAVVLGTSGVNGAIAGLAIGWGLAAATHLAFGSPAGRPTRDHVMRALRELGAPVDDLELPSPQPRGSSLALATLADGRACAVRVYGRDAADTQLIAKTWRTIAYKDSGPTYTVTRLQQVEHEALCLLAARDVGVRVPQIVAAGVAGPSAALLAYARPDGGLLRNLSGPDPIWAAALWSETAPMWKARITHGALDSEHLVIDGDAVTLVDFDRGGISSSRADLAQDRAQALVTTALRVGAEAAVDIATAAVDRDELAATQRYLTKPALTHATRLQLRGDKKQLLDELATALAARGDGTVVRPVELRRVSPLTLVMIAGLLFALWIILSQVGSLSNLWDTMKAADWPWLVVGFICAQLTSVAFATTTLGSVPQAIPLFPAVILQMAVSFVNLVAPTGTASTLMNIRFLQKQGVEVGVATSSGVLVGLSGTIAQFGLFVVTAFAVGQQGSLSQIGGAGRDGSLILIGVIVVSAIIATVLVVPKVRRFTFKKVWPQVKAGLRNVWDIFTTPKQLIMVLGGSIGAQLLYSLCLLACLHAYGGSLSLGEIIFVNTSASFLASLVPAPGGIGIAEATLIAALTAFGIPSEMAVATVVTHRIFTTYLPPLWGSYASKWLIAEGYL